MFYSYIHIDLTYNFWMGCYNNSIREILHFDKFKDNDIVLFSHVKSDNRNGK